MLIADCVSYSKPKANKNTFFNVYFFRNVVLLPSSKEYGVAYRPAKTIISELNLNILSPMTEH